jgi:DNA-binding NarL/FixJ family response regulator
LASTRILLVALPRMLEEIVSHMLRSQRGMEVAGTMRSVDRLSRKVARARPDVVVLGGDDPPLAAELLEQSPRIKVLAVAEEGQDSWLYSLIPERTRLGALSSARLVQAVRNAVRPRAASAWWNR